MLIPVVPVFPVVKSIMEIFGFLIIGSFAARHGYFQEKDTSRISKFIVDFLLPMLIFNSIVSNLQKSSLGTLWILPLLGFSMVFAGFCGGFICKRFMKHKKTDIQKTFHYLLTINNFTFLPVILVSNIWGDEALANLFLFNLGYQLAYWTIGVSILNGKKALKDYKHIFSPSLIAIILAILIVIFDLKSFVPSLFLTICKKGGGATIPMIMFTIGASVFFTKINLPDGDMIKLIFLRLIIFPALFVFALSLLPCRESIMIIPVIVALMPVPVSSVVLTRRFGGCPAFAGEAAVYTTFFSLFTVPGWLYLLNAI